MSFFPVTKSKSTCPRHRTFLFARCGPSLQSQAHKGIGRRPPQFLNHITYGFQQHFAMTAPKTPAAPTHQQTSNTSISEKECWTCGGNHEDEDCPHRVFIDRSYSQLAGR